MMHPCLAVPEIIEAIAGFADAQLHEHRDLFWGPPPASIALALAQTCRAFYEPASNVRWSQLYSFQPLLNLLLPPSTKKRRSSKKRPSSRKVIIPLEDFLGLEDTSNWVRFLKHSRRVRKLESEWTWDLISYLNVIQRSHPEPQAPLLPGLQHLTCFIDNGVSSTTLPVDAFAHSGLQSLKVIYQARITNPLSFDFLKSKAPMLRRLEVKVSYMAPETLVQIARSLPPSVLHLHMLTTVVLNDFPLPAAALLHLAKASALTHITACTRPRSIVSLPNNDIELFPALRSLNLTGSGPDITRVLEVICSPKIASIWLKALEQPTCSLMAQWTHTVGRHRGSLQQFVVHSHRPSDEEPPAPSHCIVDSVALRPLLQLSMLRKLRLIDTPLQLRDEFLHDLVVSCPHLQELALGSRVRWMTTGVTLEGLKSISFHCSKLRLLAITVHMPSAPEPGIQNGPPIPTARWRWRSAARREGLIQSTRHGPTPVKDAKCLKLMRMDIANSTVGDPVAFASFVSSYFPNVRQLADCRTLLWPPHLKDANRLIHRWGRKRWGKDTPASRREWSLSHNSLSRAMWNSS